MKWVVLSDLHMNFRNCTTRIARTKLIELLHAHNTDYKSLRELVNYDSHLDEHNIEQLTAKLLFDLTRNTGFEISKGTIGECWINSCCEWNERQDDDICGLDSERLSLYDKMKIIYENTCLKEQFKTAGLEVTL